MGVFGEIPQRGLSPAVVIGTGLIGTSVALALRAQGVAVHLRDFDAEHLRQAESMGAGTAVSVSPEAAALVVVAVPPGALSETIAAALDEFPAATVTDVGSVKGTILARLSRAEHDMSRYVGSHPMAGSEQSGPLAANAELFQDRTWVITPHDTSAANAVLDVRKLVQLCGGRAVSLGAAHHDEAVAQVSHLPQLVSALMAGLLTGIPAEHLRLSGQGLRDVTRIANSDPALWRQIISANSRAVHSQLQVLQAHLQWLMDRFDDPSQIEAFLAEGRAGRQALPGKHGSQAQDFAVVTVEIPDEPGALARIFAAVEAAGVNTEDVAIDHDQNRQVGFLELSVVPDSAEKLSLALTAQGWKLKDPT
jgi:prephenate dehydrogenase